MALRIMAPPGFIVMWNMPGCLPEAEPVHAATIAEAVELLVVELETLEINAESDAKAAAYAAMADSVAEWNGPGLVYGPDGDPYAYSIIAVATERCEECGAHVSTLVSDRHETSCSLHPDNIVG